MGLVAGNVVGVSIGGASPIAGLVLRIRRDTPNKEAIIDAQVAILSVHGDVAVPMTINDVPHLDDGPGHYTWNYGGPELLVRKAGVDPDLAAGADAAGASPVTSDSGSSAADDPAASGGAPQ